MGDVRSLNRTLEQELFALLRGASLECPVCGEFVMRVRAAVVCPECRSIVWADAVAGESADVFAAIDATAG